MLGTGAPTQGSPLVEGEDVGGEMHYVLVSSCRRGERRTGPGSVGSIDGIVTDNSVLPLGYMDVYFR